MNILIIEDDKECRGLIKLHLLKFKDAFYSLEIHEAGTVEAGKEIYNDREPDMVILDGNLPDSNFEETLKLIPTFAVNSAVVMLTNQERMDGIVEAMKLGAVDYLTKQVLGDGKNFIKILTAAWSSFERKKISQTGAMPTLRVKQVGEELVAAAEKTMTPIELRNLIDFSQYAKANIEELTRKITRLYTTVYEGNESSNSPSMKQEISEMKEKTDQIHKKLTENLELDKVKVTERWKVIGAIVVALGGALGVFANFAVEFLKNWTKLH